MIGRSKVTAERVLYDVPPRWMLVEARVLKLRLDVLVDRKACLDHLWVGGRRKEDAYAVAAGNPDWGYCDIVSCFSNIDQHRLWWLLGRKDRELLTDVKRFVKRLGCAQGLPGIGIPEGCSPAPTLANLYLEAIDRRWAGSAVRCGDNWACSNTTHLRAQLSDIGLVAEERPTFTSEYPPRRGVTSRRRRRRPRSAEEAHRTVKVRMPVT